MEELQPKLQLTMSLESQGLALFHLGQVHSAAFQCRASLCPTFVIKKLLKNCPSSPRRQLQGSAGTSDGLVNVSQHSEGGVTSKGT